MDMSVCMCVYIFAYMCVCVFLLEVRGVIGAGQKIQKMSTHPSSALWSPAETDLPRHMTGIQRFRGVATPQAMHVRVAIVAYTKSSLSPHDF